MRLVSTPCSDASRRKFLLHTRLHMRRDSISDATPSVAGRCDFATSRRADRRASAKRIFDKPHPFRLRHIRNGVFSIVCFLWNYMILRHALTRRRRDALINRESMHPPRPHDEARTDATRWVGVELRDNDQMKRRLSARGGSVNALEKKW